MARADGMAYWFFSARDGPKLVDPLTGDTTPLPPFPYGDKRKMRENSRGIVYGDGTIFLYSFSKSDNNHEHVTLRAAIFSPGDTAWTVIERGFRRGRNNIVFKNNHCIAAYHDGKIFSCVDGDHCNDIWHLMAPSAGGVHTSAVESKDMWGLDSSHVLESHGELLRVSILVMYLRTMPLVGGSKKRVVTVLVHALEEDVGADSRRMVRRARRDGLSFADRVMFLGFPSSFAVDATRFHGVEDNGIGGCVYFFQRCSGPSTLGVFRHNLIDGKTKLMEHLLSKWSDRKNNAAMWLVPRPTIAPVQSANQFCSASRLGSAKESSRVRDRGDAVSHGAPVRPTQVFARDGDVASGRDVTGADEDQG